MRLLLFTALLLFAMPDPGLAQKETPPNERVHKRSDEASEKVQRELQERKDQKEKQAPPAVGQPAIVPEGWHTDFRYDLKLFDYLRQKQASAAVEGRSTYVYVFADWSDTCKAFRESASRKEYQELLAGSDVLMIEYGFLKRVYKAQIKRVPAFIRVHENGVLGPEYLRPISSTTDHPRKAYYKLKKFLEAG